MSTRDVAERHRAQRLGLALAAATEGRRLWRMVNQVDLSTWSNLFTRLMVALIGAQEAAAGQADGYLHEVLAEQGIDADPLGRVEPSAFSGAASDGRPLESLLWSPVVSAKTAIARGVSPSRAMASGEATLDMVVRTQVADAGRVADGVAMTARTRIAGYERVVHLPACGRCVVLAGRLYRWSQGFQRHPRCDCTMLPVTRDEWRNERPENTPERLFEDMTPEQREQAFTKAGARAIADGANPSQVVNARRGMSAAGTTREGITRRGIAGARLITGDETAFTAPRTGGDTTVVSRFTRETRAGPRTVRLRGARRQRLMPEQIYHEATSRDEAISLLRQHGYII